MNKEYSIAFRSAQRLQNLSPERQSCLACNLEGGQCCMPASGSQSTKSVIHGTPIFDLEWVGSICFVMSSKNHYCWHSTANALFSGASAGSIGREMAQSPGKTCGVSSFAFQGTNAHVLLQRSASLGTQPAVAAASPDRCPIWQKRRWWFEPKPNLMLPCVTPSQSSAEFQLLLGQASLAYLWDHQVNRMPVPEGNESHLKNSVQQCKCNQRLAS